MAGAAGDVGAAGAGVATQALGALAGAGASAKAFTDEMGKARKKGKEETDAIMKMKGTRVKATTDAGPETKGTTGFLKDDPPKPKAKPKTKPEDKPEDKPADTKPEEKKPEEKKEAPKNRRKK